MKKTVMILSLLLVLPIIALAQTENDTEEVIEIKLNDNYSFKLRQIFESEYTNRKQESEHLRHKPYKIITDIAEVQKLLGRRLKVFEMEEYAEYGNREYEITFKDGAKKRLEYYNYGFVAYFPQLEILLFEGGHGSNQPFDLNNSNYAVTFTENYPYHIRIGSPYYYSVSPDKQLRINGFHDGQDCAVFFLEKWDKLTKKYELVGWLYNSIWSLGENFLHNFCYAGNWLWTGNNKVIFTNRGGGEEDKYFEFTEFYEMELIAK